ELTLPDLADYPLIALSPDNDWLSYNQQLVNICKENDIYLKMDMSTDNLDFAKGLLLNNSHISFVPEIAIEEEVKQGMLKKLRFQSPVELSVGVYMLYRHKNDFTLHFHDLVKEYVAEHFNKERIEGTSSAD